MWRTRLDATTNWAVITAAAALTFTFNSPQSPHYVVLLVILLVLIFLASRRGATATTSCGRTACG